MEWKYALSGVLAMFGGVLASSVTSEVLDIILMSMSILSILVSLVLSIITWFRNMKKDNYLSPDEMDELQGIVHKAEEQLKDLREDDFHTEDK